MKILKIIKINKIYLILFFLGMIKKKKKIGPRSPTYTTNHMVSLIPKALGEMDLEQKKKFQLK